MNTETIALTKLRELQVISPSHDQRPLHVSAASGLVALGDHLYVVADDELHIGRFANSDGAPGELIQILPGALPLAAKERKRAKPDFEALLHLPAVANCPHGALLAMGSGSTSSRHRAVLLPLDDRGALNHDHKMVDIKPFHDAIAKIFGVPNVEGALIANDCLLLFQRGNKGARVNAVIAFKLEELTLLIAGELHAPITPLHVQRYELGSIRNVPLGFSDATVLRDGSIVFAAIAEDTENAYADGPCAGAAIGSIDASGRLQRVVCTREPAKIEGICVTSEGSHAELLLVTDADDASVPASLYRAMWPPSA